MYKLLLVSVLFAGLLTGCGGSSQESGDSGTTGAASTGGSTSTTGSTAPASSSTGSSASASTSSTTAGSSSTGAPASFPENPTKQAGQPITIVMIPKLTGIAYFNACQKGAEEAAQSLPGVKLYYQGPTEGKAEKQIELINSWIVRKPDAIAVACNNPDELAPSLRRAREKGIHVVTFDADANPSRSGREFFVNQASAQAIGNTLVDVMAKEAGPDAQTAVITSTLQAPNQTEWLKYMNQRIKEKYPKMTIVAPPYPSEEDQQKAFARTQDALKAYPQIKGIWGISSTAFPGAAEAVEQAHDTGKVAVTGLATPKPMKDFVKKGVVKTVILWNPIDLGYLTLYTADALATGKLKAGSTQLSAGRLGNKEVSGDQVLLGKPMLFTKENIDKFDF